MKHLALSLCLLFLPANCFPESSLTFSAVTHNVDCGTSSASANLTKVTWAVWIKPNLVNGAGIIGRGTSGGKNRQSFEIFFSSAIQVNVDGATTLSRTQSSTGTLVMNQWQFVAATYDDSTKTGNIYWGDQTHPVSEVVYAFKQPGVGALGNNSANHLFLGNYGAGNNGGLGKSISWAAMWNQVLNVNELQNQLNAHVPGGHAGNILSTYLGLTGTGTQKDLTGTHTCTTTGTTASADGAPISIGGHPL